MLKCTGCGKVGIVHMKKHLRYCPAKGKKKAPASVAKKKAPPVPTPPPAKTAPPPAPKPTTETQPANIAGEASEGLKFAALLRKKAADHRTKAAQLEGMAKAAESLL